VHTSPAVERLVKALRRLPGIGEKSAARLTYFLLRAPANHVAELADALARLQTDTVVCRRCFSLAERDPCRYCSQPDRDDRLLCVVEEPADLLAIEGSGGYRGRYFVLGGAISPIDGVGPEDLRLRELEQRVAEDELDEVILATNPNAEGDATAHYVAERLAAAGVRLSRIAYGMPLGGDLEYADHVTVGRSLENRRQL